MPIYEYECQKCGEKTEKYSKVKDRDYSYPCHSTEGCDGIYKRLISKDIKPVIKGFSEKNGYSKERV